MSKDLGSHQQMHSSYACSHWKKSKVKFRLRAVSENCSGEDLRGWKPQRHAPYLLWFTGNFGGHVHGDYSKRQQPSFFLKLDFLTGVVNTIFSALLFGS